MFLSVLLCLSAVVALVSGSGSITANLTVVEQNPLLFKLQFSSPVQRPPFQLLFNNIYDFPYTFMDNQTYGDTFLMQGNIENVLRDTNLEMFYLLFNVPLSVGNGQLNLASYSLLAKKNTIVINFPTVFGIIVLLGAYFFNIFTETGKLLIEFIHVFILYMFKSSIVLTLYR